MTQEGEEGADPSPVEGSVKRLIAAHLGITEPGDAVLTQARLSGRAQAPGDFRLLVPSVDPSSEASSAERCQLLASKLAEHPDIEQTFAIPPNVYLSLTMEALGELVASAVLEGGETYGRGTSGEGRRAAICYSNPNLNKPLHIGHLRNNVVAMAISQLLEEQGISMMRCSMDSDWGRHICQAIVGWRHSPDVDGPPVSTKPDHAVGEWYRRFHEENARQREAMDAGGMTALEAEVATLFKAMDEGDEHALELNRRVVSWSMEGMKATYERIGSRFDVLFPESEYRDASRRLLEEAIERGLCQRREDGSVVVDLADVGLEEVTLVRADGTHVVYAQVLGATVAWHEIDRFDHTLGIDGDQWKDGNIVIAAILDRLGYAWERNTERIYCGMVHVSGSVMSSRRGGAITIDGFLDETESLLAKKLGSDRPADIPAMALGLVKHALLRQPHGRVYSFEPDSLFGDPYAEYASMLAAMRPETVPKSMPSTDRMVGRARDSARLAMLDLGAFPEVLRRAASDRDPCRLSRYLRTLAAQRAAGSPFLSEEVLGAARTVLRRGLSTLNVDVPASLGGA